MTPLTAALARTISAARIVASPVADFTQLVNTLRRVEWQRTVGEIASKRPVVMTGGELSLKMLDLDFNPSSKYYEASLQMKANNGLFIADDFGRQQVEQMVHQGADAIDAIDPGEMLG